jgi:Uma2 family endonuclease
MPADAALITAEQLETIDIPGKKVELVRGRLLISEPPGVYHGVVAARLSHALMAFVEARKLGVVVGAAGFKIANDPDTVRAPDACFVSHARLGGNIPKSFAALAPELVAEVISPNDRRGEVLAKVGQWLAGGADLVWVIDPDRRSAQVFRADGSVSLLSADDALDGEGVLPGFSCPLSELLPTNE